MLNLVGRSKETMTFNGLKHDPDVIETAIEEMTIPGITLSYVIYCSSCSKKISNKSDLYSISTQSLIRRFTHLSQTPLHYHESCHAPDGRQAADCPPPKPSTTENDIGQTYTKQNPSRTREWCIQIISD